MRRLRHTVHVEPITNARGGWCPKRKVNNVGRNNVECLEKKRFRKNTTDGQRKNKTNFLRAKKSETTFQGQNAREGLTKKNTIKHKTRKSFTGRPHLLRDACRLQVEAQDAHALLLLFRQELLQVLRLQPVHPIQRRAAGKNPKW